MLSGDSSEGLHYGLDMGLMLLTAPNVVRWFRIRGNWDSSFSCGTWHAWQDPTEGLLIQIAKDLW